MINLERLWLWRIYICINIYTKNRRKKLISNKINISWTRSIIEENNTFFSLILSFFQLVSYKIWIYKIKQNIDEKIEFLYV